MPLQNFDESDFWFSAIPIKPNKLGILMLSFLFISWKPKQLSNKRHQEKLMELQNGGALLF